MHDNGQEIRIIWIRLASLCLLMAVAAFVSWRMSQGVDVTHTAIAVPDLPMALDGLRIVQISDFHSSWSGEGLRVLIEDVREQRPDLIVLTGDFIDGNHPNLAPCLEFASALAAVAPTYRVRGNHEYYLPGSMQAGFDERMAACGVTLLDNTSAVLSRGGANYLLTGMNDVFQYYYDPQTEQEPRDEFYFAVAQQFMGVIEQTAPAGSFPLKIMLCHQPHYWSCWQQAGYDVALCGHLHGWNARLPEIGGVFRLPSRFFPEEDSGLYDKEGMSVYISRGLCNLSTWRNIRLNNQPELTVIDIRKK